MAECEIFRGTLARIAVSPRDILKQALICGASGFFVFHTHPSGNPAPSADDLSFTRNLAKAADAVGMFLQDHMIVGLGGRWVPLRAQGFFDTIR